MPTLSEIKTLVERMAGKIGAPASKLPTYALGYAYELAHCVGGQDCRRMAFQHQIDLLAVLSPVWAERETQRHREILQWNPFDDFSDLRARLCRLLRDQGQTPSEAWNKACERYPLPSETTGRTADD